MEIRAAEISAILKEQIANFGTETDVAEVGQVMSVGDGVARVYGLDNVQAGEMVEFPGGIRGMALNLETTMSVSLSSATTATSRKATRSSGPAPSLMSRSARACSAAWLTLSAIRSTARARSKVRSAACRRQGAGHYPASIRA